MRRLGGVLAGVVLAAGSLAVVGVAPEAGGQVQAAAAPTGHVYWANSTGSIGRANLDGTSPNLSFITGASGRFGVAVDYGPATVSASTTDGRSVAVSGAGFPPGAVLTVTIQSTPLVLGTVTTDASGSFTKTFSVPCTVEAGAHTVTAAASNGQSASAPVTLVACAVTVTPKFAG